MLMANTVRKKLKSKTLRKGIHNENEDSNSNSNNNIIIKKRKKCVISRTPKERLFLRWKSKSFEEPNSRSITLLIVYCITFGRKMILYNSIIKKWRNMFLNRIKRKQSQYTELADLHFLARRLNKIFFSLSYLSKIQRKIKIIENLSLQLSRRKLKNKAKRLLRTWHISVVLKKIVTNASIAVEEKHKRLLKRYLLSTWRRIYDGASTTRISLQIRSERQMVGLSHIINISSKRQAILNWKMYTRKSNMASLLLNSCKRVLSRKMLLFSFSHWIHIHAIESIVIVLQKHFRGTRVRKSRQFSSLHRYLLWYREVSPFAAYFHRISQRRLVLRILKIFIQITKCERKEMNTSLHLARGTKKIKLFWLYGRWNNRNYEVSLMKHFMITAKRFFRIIRNKEKKSKMLISSELKHFQFLKHGAFEKWHVKTRVVFSQSRILYSHSLLKFVEPAFTQWIMHLFHTQREQNYILQLDLQLSRKNQKLFFDKINRKHLLRLQCVEICRNSHRYYCCYLLRKSFQKLQTTMQRHKYHKVLSETTLFGKQQRDAKIYLTASTTFSNMRKYVSILRFYSKKRKMTKHIKSSFQIENRKKILKLTFHRLLLSKIRKQQKRLHIMPKYKYIALSAMRKAFDVLSDRFYFLGLTKRKFICTRRMKKKLKSFLIFLSDLCFHKAHRSRRAAIAAMEMRQWRLSKAFAFLRNKTETRKTRRLILFEANRHYAGIRTYRAVLLWRFNILIPGVHRPQPIAVKIKRRFYIRPALKKWFRAAMNQMKTRSTLKLFQNKKWKKVLCLIIHSWHCYAYKKAKLHLQGCIVLYDLVKKMKRSTLHKWMSAIENNILNRRCTIIIKKKRIKSLKRGFAIWFHALIRKAISQQEITSKSFHAWLVYLQWEKQSSISLNVGKRVHMHRKWRQSLFRLKSWIKKKNYMRKLSHESYKLLSFSKGKKILHVWGSEAKARYRTKRLEYRQLIERFGSKFIGMDKNQKVIPKVLIHLVRLRRAFRIFRWRSVRIGRRKRAVQISRWLKSLLRAWRNTVTKIVSARLAFHHRICEWDDRNRTMQFFNLFKIGIQISSTEDKVVLLTQRYRHIVPWKIWYRLFLSRVRMRKVLVVWESRCHLGEKRVRFKQWKVVVGPAKAIGRIFIKKAAFNLWLKLYFAIQHCNHRRTQSAFAALKKQCLLRFSRREVLNTARSTSLSLATNLRKVGANLLKSAFLKWKFASSPISLLISSLSSSSSSSSLLFSENPLTLKAIPFVADVNSFDGRIPSLHFTGDIQNKWKDDLLNLRAQRSRRKVDNNLLLSSSSSSSSSLRVPPPATSLAKSKSASRGDLSHNDLSQSASFMRSQPLIKMTKDEVKNKRRNLQSKMVIEEIEQDEIFSEFSHHHHHDLSPSSPILFRREEFSNLSMPTSPPSPSDVSVSDAHLSASVSMQSTPPLRTMDIAELN